MIKPGKSYMSVHALGTKMTLNSVHYAFKSNLNQKINQVIKVQRYPLFDLNHKMKHITKMCVQCDELSVKKNSTRDNNWTLLLLAKILGGSQHSTINY